MKKLLLILLTLCLVTHAGIAQESKKETQKESREEAKERQKNFWKKTGRSQRDFWKKEHEKHVANQEERKAKKGGENVKEERRKGPPRPPNPFKKKNKDKVLETEK